jgi:ribonucleoside-diphosphate reductase beta chain
MDARELTEDQSQANGGPAQAKIAPDVAADEAEVAATDGGAAHQAYSAILERTDRDDFQATTDPAVMEGADRGEVKLLDYGELYGLWERQQWRTQDLDFSQDKRDWEGFDEEERFQRMYGLASFFVGEQKVADELGPIMRAAPTEEQRIFLATQIADEARHIRFFERFYSEVGVLETENLAGHLKESHPHLNVAFGDLFDEMLKSRVDRLAADPSDQETLVEAITLYHMVIEGMLALTGQHFILDYNERERTLPGFVEGFNKVARDEHRHVAFGARFLREKAKEDPRYGAAIQRMLEESLPVADKVLSPPWVEPGTNWTLFGYTLQETREFAAKALFRRLKVIGLAPA